MHYYDLNEAHQRSTDRSMCQGDPRLKSDRSRRGRLGAVQIVQVNVLDLDGIDGLVDGGLEHREYFEVLGAQGRLVPEGSEPLDTRIKAGS